MRHDSAVDEHAWHKRTEMPLIVASLAYLVAYSWRVIADLHGPAWTIATVVILVTWAMFIVDYLVRLMLAENRRLWFRKHLPALTFAVVPVLRLVRLLRFLTRIPGMKTTAGGVLRTQILVYGVGASLILIYIASLAVLEVERNAPGADITTFPIALWWSCVTVTTTGFGDYTPVTDAGRWVGVGLMLGGVALAGVLTATLASWVLERAARHHDDEEPATRAQFRALMDQVEALSAAAGSAGSAGPGSAAGSAGPGSAAGSAGPGSAAGSGGSTGSTGSTGPAAVTGSLDIPESVSAAESAGQAGSAGSGGSIHPVDTGGADPDRGSEGEHTVDGSGGDARPGG
jgi:voltage-gated potassium channel